MATEQKSQLHTSNKGCGIEYITLNQCFGLILLVTSKNNVRLKLVAAMLCLCLRLQKTKVVLQPYLLSFLSGTS